MHHCIDWQTGRRGVMTPRQPSKTIINGVRKMYDKESVKTKTKREELADIATTAVQIKSSLQNKTIDVANVMIYNKAQRIEDIASRLLIEELE